MPFSVPLETVVDGELKKKGWYRVTKGTAGDLLAKAVNPPRTMTEAATRLILKLSAGHRLEPHEIVAIKLLHGMLLMGSQKAQYQAMGHKAFMAALDEYLQTAVQAEQTSNPEVQARALRDLGLVG